MSQQINLFNPIFRKQKKYFSALTMVQSLGVLVAGMLAFYGFAAYQVAGMARQAAEISRQLEKEQARLTAYNAEIGGRKKNSALEDEIRQAENRLKEHEDVLAFLQSGKLGNVDGFSEFMRAFARQSVNGLWLTGFSIAADRMEIAGASVQAELVPHYVQRLGQERVMQGRMFAALEMKGGEKKHVEFRLQSAEPDGVRKE